MIQRYVSELFIQQIKGLTYIYLFMCACMCVEVSGPQTGHAYKVGTSPREPIHPPI